MAQDVPDKGGNTVKRILVLGVVVMLGLSVFAIACSDDDNGGDDEPVATATQSEGETPSAGETPPAGETPLAGTPTAPLSSELPPDVIDAVQEYIVEGNIPAFPAVDGIDIASECTTAGQVCYDPDGSTFDEETADVRVYPYASDEIQDVSLELVDGEWVVTGNGAATE